MLQLQNYNYFTGLHSLIEFIQFGTIEPEKFFQSITSCHTYDLVESFYLFFLCYRSGKEELNVMSQPSVRQKGRTTDKYFIFPSNRKKKKHQTHLTKTNQKDNTATRSVKSHNTFKTSSVDKSL